MVCQICWQRRETNGKRMRGGDSKGKPSVFFLMGSCVMCGNGVATAVSTYAPLFLSCCPAPWTAVPPAHTRIHTQTRRQNAPFIHQWVKEGGCDSADQSGGDVSVDLFPVQRASPENCNNMTSWKKQFSVLLNEENPYYIDIYLYNI